MYCVKTEDLSCKMGSRNLIKDIHIQIKRGEYWVLLGNNGCGKTTLASVLAGYQPYSDGKIEILGQTLNEENAIELRKKIGFVSSSYFNRYVRYENGINIVLGAKCGTLSDGIGITEEDVIKAKKILTAFGLKQKGLYPYDLLSKGQQQKVLIARIFMMLPELLILDEPCTGLDIMSRDYFMNTLQNIAEKKLGSMLYITHHTDEILPFFTHAALMKDGQIHSQGEIKTIFTESNMSDFFGMETEVVNHDGQYSFKMKNNLYLDKDIWMR